MLDWIKGKHPGISMKAPYEFRPIELQVPTHSLPEQIVRIGVLTLLPWAYPQVLPDSERLQSL